MPIPERELPEAPSDLIQEATVLHPYAEAAYTGPLLDFGRNPILFPCAWLYRQGVLTPWTRNRRPALEGDNWWRGHAAAFLRFVKLQPEALLQGRVCQTRREAAYFMVALHEERTIVITVRGTETPEDLLTDGLCRECNLSSQDLDGLVNEHLPENTREKVLSTFPHYGHGGMVESARELFMQIDGNSDSGSNGFLTSLLGEGGKCHGYKLRIVGHSLGGAVATLLGIRLRGRYCNLHVYAYGSLPCVDPVIAEACSDFITTIICNDEFSSRLSVNSILRLRSAAISALSDPTSADLVMLRNLARRILHINSDLDLSENNNNVTLVPPTNNCIMQNGFAENSEIEIISNGHRSYNGIVPINIPSPSLINMGEGQSLCGTSSYREVLVEPPEMFLAGTIIHIVRQQRGIFTFPLWRWWSLGGANQIPFKAYVSRREYFQDMLVTPYMFTDHLPWRCDYAMRRVLEAHNCKSTPHSDCVEEHLV
ncbi:sn1-specific diacylglycerol lipase beta-like isoform X4 [Carex littledalei]|uniref:Sn1-specific diacylglycerol lipase beta-like isoform X4 n=1 Tax=Carex littledalei TaxID=544730 RepID=A0A833VFM0_9POAL|nr:sn1-specific diacylglycerol lipase beta-like isoform X4 [Carex littledalei]